MQEYEVLYTDINPLEIRKKLRSIGAKKIFSKKYRWLNFEYPDWRLDKQHSWIRLRRGNNKTTLAFKKVIGYKKGKGKNDLGMQETEFEVSDFKKAHKFFIDIGMVIKFDIEKKREHWQYKDVEFDIDKYPLIPTILEIESTSWKKVDKGIELLGLDESKKNVFTAYQVYKDMGIDIENYSIIHFDKQVKRKAS